MTRLPLALVLVVTATASAAAAEGYDTSGRLISRTTNGASYTPDGRLLHLHTKHGNISKTYDTNGRLLNIGIKRGNTQFLYDPNGRLIGRGFYNTGRVYDVHGRYILTPVPGRMPTLQNICLSSDVANRLSWSHNWRADGDGCVGLRLLQMLRRQRGS